MLRLPQDDDGHPYGVEPLGNIFLGRSSNCKPKGLGTLATFDVSVHAAANNTGQFSHLHTHTRSFFSTAVDTLPRAPSWTKLLFLPILSTTEEGGNQPLRVFLKRRLSTLSHMLRVLGRFSAACIRFRRAGTHSSTAVHKPFPSLSPVPTAAPAPLCVGIPVVIKNRMPS